MEYLPFFLALLASVLFALAFRRFHLPWVLALISAGMVIGPYGLAITDVTPTISFIGEVGLIFLMFMAGLEIQFSSFRNLGRSVTWLALLNGGIPFVAGAAVGYWFGFSLTASLLLGTIFMSSSIAVIIPTLEATGLIKKKLGRTIVATTVLVDVASLVALSILLQSVDPVTSLPLFSFYPILAVILVAFAYGLPRLRALIPHRRDEQDLFESEVRIIMALLIGVVVTFELLGLHPIIAGFFAGLVLSDSIRSKILIDKLHTVGYGVFIPVFFVVIGMETNVRAIFSDSATWGLVLLIILTSVATKLGSGWLGGRFLGFSNKESLTIGFASVPQLSTTLAVVFAAVSLGLLPASLTAAMVALSIVTTLIAPLSLRHIYGRA
jgi:Kef-type K+ transport system membrane component KefB